MSRSRRKPQKEKKKKKSNNIYYLRSDSKPRIQNSLKPAKPPKVIEVPKDLIFEITGNDSVFWKMSSDGLSDKHN